MTDHPTGTREEHLRARIRLLAAEKQHTRQGDELATQRRALPWVRVDQRVIQAYQHRMGWTFPWVSSLHNAFNADFGVSFPAAPAGPSQRDMPRGPDAVPADAVYNFTGRPFAAENPGLSAFALDGGVVYHTYSCYARGLDAFNATFQLLDRAPRGRDEDAQPVPFGWVRRHDEYPQAAPAPAG